MLIELLGLWMLKDILKSTEKCATEFDKLSTAIAELEEIEEIKSMIFHCKTSDFR